MTTVYQLCSMDACYQDDHDECLDALMNGNAIFATLAGAKNACLEDEAELAAESEDESPSAKLVWVQETAGRWTAKSGNSDDLVYIIIASPVRS